MLVTQENPTGYRVHRGVLVRYFSAFQHYISKYQVQSRHSEIFNHMLDIPQPIDATELLEGCQVVVMYDSPVELANLISALYDGP